LTIEKKRTNSQHRFGNRGVEAVEKVIEYLFNTIKVQKIEAFSHRDNKRSIKLLEKFSFKDSNES
jgi:ribosomal-protein-alanine N-acetyltransferase